MHLTTHDFTRSEDSSCHLRTALGKCWTRPDRDGSPALTSVLYPCRQVMSISVKPRLADRQPSIRGGVLRVMTGLWDRSDDPRQARVRRSDPTRVELALPTVESDQSPCLMPLTALPPT